MFPIAIAVKTTPIVAIAPLLVIWLGTGLVVEDRGGHPDLLFSGAGEHRQGTQGRRITNTASCSQTLGASSSQEFRKLRVPYCLPYLFSALKISSSLAIVGAIVGEFVGAEHGLGYLIIISSAHLETATLFSGDLAPPLSPGIAMFYVIGWAEQQRRSSGAAARRNEHARDVVSTFSASQTKGPGDVSGLIELIEDGQIDPSSILAVLGKTEGNGGVNDFTREYAMAAFAMRCRPIWGYHRRSRRQDRLCHVGRHRRRAIAAPYCLRAQLCHTTPRWRQTARSG